MAVNQMSAVKELANYREKKLPVAFFYAPPSFVNNTVLFAFKLWILWIIREIHLSKPNDSSNDVFFTSNIEIIVQKNPNP